MPDDFQPVVFVNGRGATMIAHDEKQLRTLEKNKRYRRASLEEIKIGMENAIASRGDKESITPPVDSPIISGGERKH